MDTQNFKNKLLEEQDLLIKQLGDIAVEGDNGIWTAKAPEMDVMSPIAEPNEAADKIEEIDERSEEVVTLSARLADVRKALEAVETGTYGTCEVCNAPIEEERLEANPAARTCTAHM
jgi:RNA polymerase-binding transcription factor DksA